MGRLIDADLLKECYAGTNTLDGKADYMSIRKMIEIQPTAYNVEKVVAEMERIKNDASQGCDEVSHDKCNTYKNCADCIFDRIICIVKAGGVDG